MFLVLFAQGSVIVRLLDFKGTRTGDFLNGGIKCWNYLLPFRFIQSLPENIVFHYLLAFTTDMISVILNHQKNHLFLFLTVDYSFRI